MKSYTVTGGGGVKLHVEEAGNPYGPPILFIHGFSQCGLCWNKQFDSFLAEGHRLVRMDLRGHGLSDKPKDAYGDSKLWAEDVAAVIEALDLDRPILSGWSYGGVVICDYLRFNGTDRIGGVHLVAAVSKLGEAVVPHLGEEFVSLIPGFFSTDAEESAAALGRFMRIAVAAEPTREDHYFALGYNTIVPPHVREALFSRSLDNDDLLTTLSAPVLLSYGANDEIVLLSMGEHHKVVMPNATYSVHQGIGHAPFHEDADRFNRDLAAFALAAQA
jgi:pimeloyl-ACP methyl ester carboxylesterase